MRDGNVTLVNLLVLNMFHFTLYMLHSFRKLYYVHPSTNHSVSLFYLCKFKTQCSSTEAANSICKFHKQEQSGMHASILTCSLLTECKWHYLLFLLLWPNTWQKQLGMRGFLSIWGYGPLWRESHDSRDRPWQVTLHHCYWNPSAMNAGAQLAFSFIFSSGPSPWWSANSIQAESTLLS